MEMMDTCIWESSAWAEANFGKCNFGDARLTRRLVKIGEKCVASPDYSTPKQTEIWSDCKGAYRFMDNDKVSFAATVSPHCERTRNLAKQGTWLSVCDSSELSFSRKREIEGLGKTGDNTGQGFFIHSSLLVSDEGEEVLGLAAQELYYRIPGRRRETNTQRKKRQRNSEVWGRIVQQVGTPQPGARIIHVCDRAADDYELFTHCQLQQTGWVVRAQQLNRKIYAATAYATETPEKDAEIHYLRDFIDSQPIAGKYDLAVASRKGCQARTAKIEVRSGNIWMPRSPVASPWLKKHGPAFIKMGVVEVKEVGLKKKSVKPVHWVLLCDEVQETFDDAWRAIGRYKKRWIIEDYHKALKTGCSVEDRLYRTNKRLERVTAIFSVLAVRLIQFRQQSRTEPQRKAKGIVPRRWLVNLCRMHRERAPKAKSKWVPSKLSIGEFMRGLAMLGGFLGRKCDGQPGWITLWRGVKDLMIVLRATRRLSKRRN